MTKQDKRGPREQTYDSEMSQHVKALIALAKQHKIPLIVAVELDSHPGEETNPLRCISVIYGEDYPFRSHGLQRAVKATRPETTTFLSVMMLDGPVPR